MPHTCHWLSRQRFTCGLLTLTALTLLPGCLGLQRRMASQNVVMARQLTLRGADAVQRGQWEQAESLFAEAIRKCAVDERAQCGYAQALWHGGRRAQAIEHMEEAVRLSAGDPELLVQLGQMYLDQDAVQAALEQAADAIQARPQLASAWALRGEALKRQGDLQEALASYHRALAYHPSDPATQLALAEIYRLQDRPLRALTTLEALADQYPPGEVPAQVNFLEGLALKRLGRYQEAIPCLAQAADQGGPSQPDVLFHLAEARLWAGDAAGARLTVDQALQQFPEHAASQHLLAQIEHHRMVGISGTSPTTMRH